MKKNFKIYAICWVILVAVFNVICFVTPSEAAGMSKFGGAFWVGYIFISVAFIGQLVCAFIAFKAGNLQKMFYNLPLITVSYGGLILSVVIGTLCMAIPNLPNWVGIIVCLLILAFNAISVLKASAAAEIVSGVDEKVKAKTLFIKSLTVDADSLLARATTSEAKDACKKVYEAIRYSDPMSNEAVFHIESRIKEEFDVFTDAVLSDNFELTESSEKELLNLIDERNSNIRLIH